MRIGSSCRYWLVSNSTTRVQALRPGGELTAIYELSNGSAGSRVFNALVRHGYG